LEFPWAGTNVVYEAPTGFLVPKRMRAGCYLDKKATIAGMVVIIAMVMEQRSEERIVHRKT
jgi:hypothetical protein